MTSGPEPNVPKDDDPLTVLPGLSQACKNQLNAVRVAVVGGGLAGLAAGLRLSRHGVKVTVYEPHTEWGGRVRSTRTFANGRVIELGAELIGAFHTAWLRLAQHYGLAMVNRMDQTDYERERLNLKLRLNGKDLTWPEIKKLDGEVDKILEIISADARSVAQETCPWQESDPQRKKILQGFDNMSVADVLRKHGVAPTSSLWKMLELRLVNDEVAPLEQMNYLGLLCKVKGGQGDQTDLGDSRNMGYWEELEIFRCADGCQSLADQMVAEIKNNGGEVVSRTAVAQIDIGAKEVVLIAQRVKWIKQWTKPDRYELGPKVKVPPFQYVVLAIPPTVWKDLVVTFDGSKEDLETYVGKMENGPAVKFFSRLRERFWIKEEGNVPMLGGGSGKVRGFAPSGGTLKLGQIWEGTDNQTQAGGQATVLSVFAGPLLPGKTKGTFRPPNESEMRIELRNLYSGYERALIRGKSPYGGPTLYQDWPHEPFIMTGYWTPKPDGEIFRVGPKLNTPFHDRLYFAGDHTYPSFFGYMEGGLRSGIRAANMLMIKICGIKVPDYYPCPPPPDVRVANAGGLSSSNGMG
jgi:monoamine oxidase